MNLKKFYQKTLSYIKKEKIMFSAFVFLLLFFSGVLLLVNSATSSLKQETVTAEPSRYWQIIFNYNNPSQTLSVQTVSLKKGIAVKSPYTDSGYKLQVLSSDKNILYQSDVQISRE